MCQLRSGIYVSLYMGCVAVVKMNERTEFKVVVVGKRVIDLVNIGGSSENILRHLVHGGLDRGTVVLGEPLEGNVSGIVVRLVKLGGSSLDGAQVRKRLPVPRGIDIGGHDAVPGLGESGKLVAVEAVKGRASALEDGKVGDARVDGNAIAAGDAGDNVALLFALLDEAVRVRLSVDIHADPALGDNLDIDGVDVAVLFDKVVAQDGGKELGRGDGVLLGEDEDGVLHCVCGDDDAVVGLCVGSLNVALEQDADDHFGDCVDARFAVAIRLEDADIVLAIAGGGDGGHFWD